MKTSKRQSDRRKKKTQSLFTCATSIYTEELSDDNSKVWLEFGVYMPTY